MLTKLVKRNDDRSPKQILVELRRDGHIGDRALRGLSQALDALIEKGVNDPLPGLLAEFDAGNITFAGQQLVQTVRPTLADIPAEIAESLTPKGKLIWLRDQGTITDDQLRLVAMHLNAASKAGTQVTDETVADALANIGAAQALPRDEQRGPDQKWGEDEQSKFLNTTASKIGEALEKVDSVDVLVRLEARERQHPTRKGGRASVLELIERRRQQIEETPAAVPVESQKCAMCEAEMEPLPAGQELTPDFEICGDCADSVLGAQYITAREDGLEKDKALEMVRAVGAEAIQ